MICFNKGYRRCPFLLRRTKTPACSFPENVTGDPEAESPNFACRKMQLHHAKQKARNEQR